MREINRRQALVPAGAAVLENSRGTAPGLWIERSGTSILLLPGPPREMQPILERVIEERLKPKAGGRGLFRRVMRLTGRSESEMWTPSRSRSTARGWPRRSRLPRQSWRSSDK